MGTLREYVSPTCLHTCSLFNKPADVARGMKNHCTIVSTCVQVTNIMDTFNRCDQRTNGFILIMVDGHSISIDACQTKGCLEWIIT